MPELKPSRMEWWPLPREGEVVPDYPPQDITSAVSSVRLDPPSAADWAEEHLGASLAPWQREVVNRMFTVKLAADATRFIEAVDSARAAVIAVGERLLRARMSRVRSGYRRRLLARRRRNR